jgi:hypothetical protein
MQQHPFVRSQRPGRRIALRFAATLSLLALALTGAAVGCESAVQGPPCDGGVINADGVCVGKCIPANCLPGNTCVDNRCVLECTSHSDCDGTQNCAPAVEDGLDARAIYACQPNSQPSGTGSSCFFGNECGLIASCKGTGTPCDLSQCGGVPDACKLDTEYCGVRANCLVGKCPDGSACTALTCKPDECETPLVCLTSGEGDADAYCSKHDCTTDADCGGGYYCGVTRDPHELCGSADPKKGDNGVCGETVEECINSATFGEGNSFFEGQLCILRKTCMKREECAPCETDLDCSQGGDMSCITMPNESQKRCARPCGDDKDCGRDFACQPADANDPAKGNVCVHRFGACVGSGKFCEPCLDDTHCGPLDGRSVCLTASDGQHGCADLSFPVMCTKDDDCPTSPSGKHAVCVLDAGSNIYQRCYYWTFTPTDPLNPDQGGKYGCW